MRDWQGQWDVKWYCKYHVAFVPKYRRRSLYGALRREIGKILRELYQQQGVEIVEGHAMPDHIHLCLSISPKYSVANTLWFLKGKSAIRIHRQFLEQKRTFTRLHFRA
jgi:putative transposase